MHFCFVVVAAGEFEFAVEAVVFFHGGIELLALQGAEFLGESKHFGLDGEDVFEPAVHFFDEGFVAVEYGFLGQIADLEVLFAVGLADLWGHLAEDYFEKGGFAGAVGADEA